ncbi:tetratricopeptide repeat protein [Shewanella marina]|uniref:tetratricopeptide repeat protein n=1 Tax=Shewanella marina TaxID=487319 RepID=UPI000472827D|nr:tetratricopeptide repeat protein [Shewanella marina]
MEIYSTEEQQVDAIKQFWKSYGIPVAVGVVVGLGGLYAWNHYSDSRIQDSELSSVAFQNASAKSANDPAVEAALADFDKKYDQPGYQALLELIVAKSAVEAGNFEQAENVLKKVIADKPDQSLQMLALLRLARLQAHQGQVATALATLEQVTVTAFDAQRDELKGDFLVAQGELDKAKQAYQAAIEHGGATNNPALQMKLDNLNQA